MGLAYTENVDWLLIKLKEIQEKQEEEKKVEVKPEPIVVEQPKNIVNILNNVKIKS